jgi:hypothetical protein
MSKVSDENKYNISPEELKHIHDTFYACPKIAKDLGGGGPFSNDIHQALEFHYVLKMYNCDAIIETGTHKGDTTEYLARMYPNLTIVTCEIDPKQYRVSKPRLAKFKNVETHLESSKDLIPKIATRFQRPLWYFDAHWDRYLPLPDEMKAVSYGVVAIHDFDIEVKGYGHSILNKKTKKHTYLNVGFVSKLMKPGQLLYANDPKTVYPDLFKTKQPKPRGRAYICFGGDDKLKDHPQLKLMHNKV